MAMNKPYFIDAADKLVDEFYGTFENEMSEQLFLYLTEENGSRKRTMMEAAEEVVMSLHGVSAEDYLNETAPEDYDYYFMQASDLAAEIMTRVLRRYAEEY